MTRKRWWIVVALAGAVGVSFFLWKARGASSQPKFRTAEMEVGTIESMVSATGTVRPVVQVEVGSQVSGTVHRIYADYNSRVRAGDVLCEIEPSSLRARVVQNQAAVVKAEVAVKDAERVLGRARELVRQDYISQAEVEAADVAVEQRRADLRQARAQLQVAEVDLRHATIRAPIDGVVIARSIDLGQTVAASLQAPRLFVIANDLSRMQVETRIDEADIGRIHRGLPVTFTVDAHPDMKFDGSVSQVRLEPIVEQGVVTYTTVIRTGNPGLRLKPGMTANVSVLVAKRDSILKVPGAALRFRPTRGEGGRGGPMAGASPGGGAWAGASGQGATAGGSPTGARRVGRGGGADGGAPEARATPDSARGEWGRRKRARGAEPGAPGPGRETPALGGEERARFASSADAMADAVPDPPSMKPGAVFVLRNGKLERIPVLTGITDGAFVEVLSDRLKPGDAVVVGMDSPARGPGLQPPPGMGGPQFGGGRPSGSRSGGR